MKRLSPIKLMFLLTIPIPFTLQAYPTITSAELHTRLVRGDSLIILDVREISEYRAGHIAEPAGQLPLTPVNMPYSSGILQAEYNRLPRDVDIIVHCAVGGRSQLAAAFLENNGFTRVYNLTGGYNGWSYETRNQGYGDHSGKWILPLDTPAIHITDSFAQDTSRIIFIPRATPTEDSIYVELNFASSMVPIPPDVPESELEGLFRVTVLDPFGLSLFKGDSLALADTIGIYLIPKYPQFKGNTTSFMGDEHMTVYIPGEGWERVGFSFDGLTFQREETLLRRWYNVQGSDYTGITSHDPPPEVDFTVYPNPFNETVKILAPEDVTLMIYDIRGRLIQSLNNATTWTPGMTMESGVYFIRFLSGNRNIVKRIVYLK